MSDTARVLRRYLWVPASLLLLAFVVWRTRPWELAGFGISLDPLLLIGVIALNGLVVALWAIRSRSLMAGVGHPLPFVTLVPIVSFANTISNLTPASAGEAVRAAVLRDRHGVPFGRSAAVILVERLWAIGIMAVTAAAAALTSLGAPTPAVAIAIWGVAIAACFAPALSYRLGLRPGRLLERWLERRPLTRDATPGRMRRVAGSLVDLDRTLEMLVGRPMRALVFVGTTWVIFACYTLQIVLLLAMLHVPIALDAAWGALGLATVAGVLSALPFGLGATDAVLALLLGQLGVAAPVAGATVILLRATATLPLGIAGALSWSILGIGNEPRAVARPRP